MTEKTTAWTGEERAEMAAQRERDNADAYEFKVKLPEGYTAIVVDTPTGAVKYCTGRPDEPGVTEAGYTPDTPAERLEAIRHMMTPGTDEQTGEEVPAALSPEEALALLDAAGVPTLGTTDEPVEFRLRDSLQWALHMPKEKR